MGSARSANLGCDRRDSFPRLPTRNYEWVFEADITACFDEIDHRALMERVRGRIADKRVLSLVKAFLRAGILSEDGISRATHYRHSARRHPLSVAGQHRPVGAGRALHTQMGALGPEWTRAKRRRQGVPASDSSATRTISWSWLRGTRGCRSAPGRGGRGTRTDGLAPVGSEDEVRHIDEGFDFLGFRIQRRAWKAGPASEPSTPTRQSRPLASAIKQGSVAHSPGTHRTLADLLRGMNPVLRGWCNYFRHGVSKRTFGYLDHFALWRIVGWLRKRHLG